MFKLLYWNVIFIKLLQYVSVTVHPDQMMLFGGTNEPCAQGSLSSIGKISKQENIKHSKAIYDKVNSALGIPKDR